MCWYLKNTGPNFQHDVNQMHWIQHCFVLCFSSVEATVMLSETDFHLTFPNSGTEKRSIALNCANKCLYECVFHASIFLCPLGTNLVPKSEISKNLKIHYKDESHNVLLIN